MLDLELVSMWSIRVEQLFWILKALKFVSRNPVLVRLVK